MNLRSRTWESGGSLLLCLEFSAPIPAFWRNPSGADRSSRFSPPTCHSLRIWLSRPAIPDRPGRLSSSRPLLRGSDAPECKEGAAFHGLVQRHPVSDAPHSVFRKKFIRIIPEARHQALQLSGHHVINPQFIDPRRFCHRVTLFLPSAFGPLPAHCKNALSITAAVPPGTKTAQDTPRSHVRLLIRRILAKSRAASQKLQGKNHVGAPT